MRFCITLLAACLTLLIPTATFGQRLASRGLKTEVVLTIQGEVPTPRNLTFEDLAKLPRRSVQTKEPDGSTVVYEGAELAEILKLAGVTFGEDLKGTRLSTFLLVSAADLSVVFALPELDSSYTERLIILADRRDGKPLSASEGPIRVIVPDEKRKSRWVKQVTTLAINKGGRTTLKKVKTR
jgi:DMSO/TMAO reductase YedYZ molybdopterin-dependent catalytic subunit